MSGGPEKTAGGGAKTSKKTDAKELAAVVLFYWVCSITTVFLNKHLLSSGGFRTAPILLMAFQHVVPMALFFLLGLFHRSLVVSLRLRAMWKLLPLCLVYVGMLATNAICLQSVSVTLYQTVRSLTIIFQLLLDVGLRRRRPKPSKAAACVLVCAGAGMTAYKNTEVTVLGACVGVLSSLFIAVYSVLVKGGLSHVRNSELSMTHHITFMSQFFFFALAGVLGEYSAAGQLFPDALSCAKVGLSGVVGCLVGFSMFLQLKRTSPLTATVSATIKACIQTMLDVLFFARDMSPLNYAGVGVSLLGSAIYSFF
ncbi:MAG: putative GDP-fucose transporter [Amphiamblys sp. WSBS2006]|nr:MAG: putative GDP-fucose transporter [Amphiamblys sp. WSBS2006]